MAGTGGGPGMGGRNRPDRVLLDAGIPEMNGFDVCRQMKHQLDTRQIPVILTSERNGCEDRIVAMEAGADDFLHKPTDPGGLKLRVNSMLRLKADAADLEKS